MEETCCSTLDQMTTLCSNTLVTSVCFTLWIMIHSLKHMEILGCYYILLNSICCSTTGLNYFQSEEQTKKRSTMWKGSHIAILMLFANNFVLDLTLLSVTIYKIQHNWFGIKEPTAYFLPQRMISKNDILVTRHASDAEVFLTHCTV